jgi:phosphatidylinositol-bisphosphatase
MPKVAPSPEQPSALPLSLELDDEAKRLDDIAGKWHERQKWFDAWQQGELKQRDLENFEETRKLQVLVINWNMHGKAAAAREAPCRLFPSDCLHHLYVVGTAECEKSIPKAILSPSGPKKKTWEKACRAALDGCVCIAEASLAATHLAVFARDGIAKHISNVKISTVSTGWKGVLGNKGGIRISLDVGGSHFLFVQSHLPSGQEKVEKRNKSATKILGGGHPTPTAGEKEAAKGSSTTGDKEAARPALDGFNHVFFLGDLNFRVNCTREEADKLIAIGDHASLLEKDQLNEQRKKDLLWRDFKEGPITFPPTYKYDKGTEYYDTSKKRRIPSWTDRILWLDNDKDPKVELVAYNALKDIRSSDHKPVFAQFDVKVPDIETSDGELSASTQPVRYETRGCSIM